MWIRSVNGKLIEINRTNYSSCVEYYIELNNTILNKNIIAKEEKNMLEYVLRIIRGGGHPIPPLFFYGGTPPPPDSVSGMGCPP